MYCKIFQGGQRGIVWQPFNANHRSIMYWNIPAFKSALSGALGKTTSLRIFVSYFDLFSGSSGLVVIFSLSIDRMPLGYHLHIPNQAPFVLI